MLEEWYGEGAVREVGKGESKQSLKSQVGVLNGLQFRLAMIWVHVKGL